MARLGKSASERSEEREKRILEALNEIQNTKQPNWAKVSRKYRISRTTLYNRYYHRTQGWRDAHVFQQKLSKEEEEEIVQWVKKSGAGRHATKVATFGGFGGNDTKTVGRQWSYREGWKALYKSISATPSRAKKATSQAIIQ